MVRYLSTICVLENLKDEPCLTSTQDAHSTSPHSGYLGWHQRSSINWVWYLSFWSSWTTMIGSLQMPQEVWWTRWELKNVNKNAIKPRGYLVTLDKNPLRCCSLCLQTGQKILSEEDWWFWWRCWAIRNSQIGNGTRLWNFNHLYTEAFPACRRVFWGKWSTISQALMCKVHFSTLK